VSHTEYFNSATHASVQRSYSILKHINISHLEINLHGAKRFLRNQSSHNWSRKSLLLMEPEGSSPCSEKPVTGPCREPRETTLHSHNLNRNYFNIISHLLLGLPSGLFLSGFPDKKYCVYVFIIFSARVTWSSHPIVLDLITIIVFGEEYKLWLSHCPIFSCMNRSIC
jgi:hypothetical protein